MPNKLKYYLSGKQKIYTLKNTIDNKPTKPAHYKFIKIKDAPNNKPDKTSRN